MNQKLIDEFNMKLGALDKELTLEIITKEKFEIKYGDETVCTMKVIGGGPVLILNPDQPICINEDNSVLLGNLIDLCGQYREAFFGDGLCDD